MKSDRIAGRHETMRPILLAGPMSTKPRDDGPLQLEASPSQPLAKAPVRLSHGADLERRGHRNSSSEWRLRCRAREKVGTRVRLFASLASALFALLHMRLKVLHTALPDPVEASAAPRKGVLKYKGVPNGLSAPPLQRVSGFQVQEARRSFESRLILPTNSVARLREGVAADREVRARANVGSGDEIKALVRAERPVCKREYKIITRAVPADQRVVPRQRIDKCLLY